MGKSNTMKVISGSSNKLFAKQLSKNLHSQLVDVLIEKFPNGEKKIRIQGQIANNNIVVVQSFSHPVDEHIIESLLLIDAIKRLKPQKIHVVIPWLGYSLQDKIYLPGEPLSAQVIAKLLSNSDADDIRLLDIHKENTLSYFSIPIYHLSAIHLFTSYIRSFLDISKLIVVSPDQGAFVRAKRVAHELHCPIISLTKERDLLTGTISFTKNKIDINHSDVLIVDDGIITGNTLLKTASILKKNGARRIIFFATHCILSKIPKEKDITKCVDKFITTNSIQHVSKPKTIHILDASSVIAQSFAA